MELRIGSPATGNNYYPRPTLIGKLLRALERDNVAFLGPRRTGKTSCLEQIKAHPGSFVPVLLNLEKHDTVEAWLAEMLAKVRETLNEPKGRLANLADKARALADGIHKIELPGVGGVEMATQQAKAQWRKPAEEFLGLLIRSEVPLLFLLDEFPTFLKLVAKNRSRDEVEAVLNWFRASRNALKDQRVRFLVTGSIGLKGVVRNLGLSPSINEFDVHEIPPLSDAEAQGLLTTLASDNEVPLDEAGRREILRLLGGNWPILLQLFISEIQDTGYTTPPTPQQLETIYRERLVHGSRNQYCDGMHDRLKDAFTDTELKLARAILKSVCKSPDGLGREDFDHLHRELEPVLSQHASGFEELDHVLETLKHDGYLLQDLTGPCRTRFGSNILRDFWRRKTA